MRGLILPLLCLFLTGCAASSSGIPARIDHRPSVVPEMGGRIFLIRPNAAAYEVLVVEKIRRFAYPCVVFGADTDQTEVCFIGTSFANRLGFAEFIVGLPAAARYGSVDAALAAIRRGQTRFREDACYWRLPNDTFELPQVWTVLHPRLGSIGCHTVDELLQAICLTRESADASTTAECNPLWSTHIPAEFVRALDQGGVQVAFVVRLECGIAQVLEAEEIGVASDYAVIEERFSRSDGFPYACAAIRGRAWRQTFGSMDDALKAIARRGSDASASEAVWLLPFKRTNSFVAVIQRVERE